MKKHLRNGNKGNKVAKNAVIYARTATWDQASPNPPAAMTAQLEECRKYARAHGLTISREIMALGSAGREQFEAMVSYVKANPACRTVLVEKTDRLFRNWHDCVRIEDLVQELDLEIHLVREGRVISANSKSQDKLVRGVHALVARNYLENLREEITKAQTAKAKNGTFPGRAPFGYLNQSRKIEVDPVTGPVVRLIFDIYKTGKHTLGSLEQAIHNTTGRAIHPSSLRQILRSRFYTGVFVWDGAEYSGKHKPLVDRKTFAKVQRLISAQSSLRVRRMR